MSQTLHSDEQAHLRQTILSRCIWSDTYSSVKHILKRTDNQLPLLITFAKSEQDHEQTILFFDRNVSNKLLFSPLKQTDDENDSSFDVYPHHCTFAATELFKGLFEFIRDGQRCARVFSNLEELVEYATKNKSAVLFMSRDRVKGYYPDTDWSTKIYNQGSVFRAERIHRVSENRKTSNDFIECLDEDGYNVFLKMNASGRYSLIASSSDQQKANVELYLHSTQTSDIDQLIKKVISNDDKNCIRLVRGPVPHNFHCQYLRFVRQHKHDVLVGLTGENLVVEWNLDSYATCRYATNLNDILQRLSGTWEEQLLETYIDDARRHYRENFQYDMQLISTRDWTAFEQYWRWTGDYRNRRDNDRTIPYQSRQRFNLVASIQDLTDNVETLLNEFKKFDQSSPKLSSHKDKEHHQSEKELTLQQKDFLKHISKTIDTNVVRPRGKRISLQNPRSTSLLINSHASPFDNSTYDSNTHSSSSTNKNKPHTHRKDSRRTQ